MTEPRPRRATAKLALTALEWKLYVVALLAVVYAVVWRAIVGGPVPSAAATAADATPPATPPAARWWHELPVAQRHGLAVPAGWRVVTRGSEPAQAAPVPRVVRAPATPRLRVRTRSS